MVLFGFLSILAALRVCGAFPPIPLNTKLTATLGETVTLPCDGSYYVQQLSHEEVERALEWSVMGDDVLSHKGEGLAAGRGYAGRAFLPPEGLVKGNFSLELRTVVLSDANIYECIWQGRKTISTIWLNVDVPSMPTAINVLEGRPVHLPCYGLVSKNLDPKQVSVDWEKDGQTILVIYGDRIVYNTFSNQYIPNQLDLNLLGNSSLTIASVGHLDQGVYRCFYRPRNAAPRKAGTPESIHLTVSSTYMDHEDSWESTGTIPMLSDDFQEDSKVTVTSSHLARGQDEAMTWSPEPDTDRLETLPWVRIGIIAGVLALTALVLGILLATHKI